jgi:hypothetical protein
MQSQHINQSGRDASVTHHLILLDRSTSMHGIRKDVIQHFNHYLNRLKEYSSDTKRHFVSFFSFAKLRTGDGFYEHYFQADASNVQELDLSSYQPNGYTPLNDGIVRASRLLYTRLELAGVPSKVNYTIITDGEENASVVETDDTVKSWVLMLQKKGWEVEYIGLDFNPEQDAIKKGILKHRSFMKDSEGMMSFLNHMSSKI